MMRIFTAILVLGLACAGCGKKEKDPTPKAASDGARTKVEAVLKTAVDDTKAVAGEVKKVVEKSERKVREKSAAAGGEIADTLDSARVVTEINGKLFADEDLSALKIDVDAEHGVVTLKGTVKALALVNHAADLALDTPGVKQVVVRLRVES